MRKGQFECYFSRKFTINRNIVECKVVYRGAVKVGGGVLIETLWNVKKAEVEKMLQSGKY